ncbi:DUF1616 domain-containing protein [Haloarcula sp. CBA1130]|uniref:DUF1616 domain-containing protein n=1 Tax=unclassified Haloarcula TaxID=2624677 RepID=UPI0012455916|nr:MULTISPECIES: DUF1616 domain-containing protein [unclassified Haloarcula]KAA9395872.1 DUF1616 domain-containing protein [Haloarcula sp. CBA1129]KAA9400198.1 DUF1616 domain-containing protein [Haloarcula sp. CBA1130]
MASDADTGIEVDTLPVDLLLVGFLGLWQTSAVQSHAGQPSVQAVLGLGAVLIAPGYALVSLLFPRCAPETGLFDDCGGRIAPGERLVLAIGVSICLVPLLGLGLVLLSFGATTGLFQFSIGVTTVLLSVVAAGRRLRVPPAERFSPMRWVTTAWSQASLRPPDGVPVLHVLLVLGLLLSGTGIGYAAMSAERGEQFTEFALVAESDNGELVASEYPSQIPLGSSATIQVTIGNHEGQGLNYTVVVIAQRIDNGTVLSTARIDRFRTRVTAGETLTRPHEMTPPLVGEHVRVSYLLYRGEAPVGSNPRPESAYRRTHIWINVTRG